MATRVVNQATDQYDVFIGRPTKWGNPFVAPGTRSRFVYVREHEDPLGAYREWIRTQPHLMGALHELRGKRLGCYCAPNPCHGDVLVELVEAQEVT